MINRKVFPVTRVNKQLSSILKGKGISVARHGEGHQLGSKVMRLSAEGLRGVSFSWLKPERKTPLQQEQLAENTFPFLNRGLNLLIQYQNSGVDLLTESFQDFNIPIDFLKGHDYVMDVVFPEGGPGRIRIDVDTVRETDPHLQQGLEVLYGMGLLHTLTLLIQRDEREALLKTIAFYENLSQEHKDALMEVLSQDPIDSGDVFLRFLKEGAGQPLAEKQRLIAWLRMRSMIDLPYNDTEVRRAIEEERDLEALRMRIYNTINDTYVETVDTENANRIAEWCLERDIRLVGGRFSRAFYLDAMLIASAKVLTTKWLQPAIADFEEVIKRELRSQTLQTCGWRLEKIGGEIQSIINLVAKQRVSLAEVDGVVGRFKQALRELEAEAITQMDRIKKVTRERRTWKQLQQQKNRLRNKVEQLMQAVTKIEEVVIDAPKQDPAFMVFFQRIFPIDAINMGMMNELRDPFFSEDEEIHQLMQEAGHHMYTTANLRAWLRKCDDWIEALPAYAHYEIVPQKGGGYQIQAFVDRFILEMMYRTHAEDWAINIEDVMTSQHVALAREWLVHHYQINFDEEIPQEEAIRRLCIQRGWKQEIAHLAALIEATFNNLCGQVARLCEQHPNRMEALKRVISEPREGNLIWELSQQLANGVPLLDASREVTQRHRLEVEKFMPLAFKKRRNLPCVHVLTTLGPGETEINVKDWLEESMALFNVCRAFNLEEKVRQRIREYRQRIAAVGRKIVEELNLEGELYRILREEGLHQDTLEHREKGILKLIASYPEVATEVAKLAVLIEHEEVGGKRVRDPENADEPETVMAYIAGHKGLEVQAIREVIRTNNLTPLVKEEQRKNRISADEAAAIVVANNPDYLTEKESLKRLMARERVIESLKLQPQVRTYLRDHQIMASFKARREIIAEAGLSSELNNPRFRYEATGPFKAYHLLYTPSRVDLGAEEIPSVRNISKWVGGLDQEAVNAGKALYELYNVAGVTAVESPKLAEFLKVGENFFSRGGVYYLSLTAGANIDVLGIGDFEFFRDQWNARGDRLVLPTGETYGGFCVPKEFSLLYAIITAAVRKETSEEILISAGVPKEIQPQVVADLRRVLCLQPDCRDLQEWEARARQFLEEKYASVLPRLFYLGRLPQLAQKLQQLGVITERERQIDFRFVNWVNKKAQGLEEINRTGPFRKVHLIRQLIKQARQRNPLIAPDNKLIGVMAAPYKEGQRKEGREIPITDVRFSAGARKLEIYAGTAERNLLKDIDPEGREIIREMFCDFQSPADIRIVGTCTGSDILNYIPGSGLEELKDRVLQRLIDAGLEEDIIDANCVLYGGDLENWSGIKDLPGKERKALIKEIGNHIHLLVLDRRGVYRSYEEAVQGVDFVDLGIPDPELLDLIDDLPKFIWLMRRGRPNSALVFADGTSGGRRRAFSMRYATSKRKVKELFALDDRAVYGALGLGRETIEAWRREMQQERQQAQKLYQALIETRWDDAERTYQQIVHRIIVQRKPEEAVSEEISARKLGVWSKDYRYVSEALSKVARGLTLSQVDFGTWVILGGRYVLNGKFDKEEIHQWRLRYEQALKSLSRKAIPAFSDQEVEEIIHTFVKPKYIPPQKEFRERETGIAGSLKAVEERTARLAKRQVRRREAQRTAALMARKRAFYKTQAESMDALPIMSVQEFYQKAKAILGEGRSPLSQEDFGEFIAWTKGMLLKLIQDSLPSCHTLAQEIKAHINDFLAGGEFFVQEYKCLATDTARLAEHLREDKQKLELIAKAEELLDIVLIIQKTIDKLDDPEGLMLEIARFFDLTINNHIFDYIPYHYHKERGYGFEGMDREEKFELAARRHRWLYTYIRHLIVTYTPLREMGPDYQNIWLGDADRGILGLGIRVEDPIQRFWFSYARLRDVAVLFHEGYPFPELFPNLDPSIIEGDKGVNVVIVYPHGNTTVPVALEQGVRLSEEENINLMLTAFPSIEYDPKYSRKVLKLYDGFMYVSRQRYCKALMASGVEAQEAKAKASGVGRQGVLIAANFSTPIIAHGVFFHFTHPLRSEIGTIGVPLIQPFVWEAATHLKCRLPEMLRGSGVSTADQLNFYQRELKGLSQDRAKAKIKRPLVDFIERHPTIVVKPEKESGGRGARIFSLQKGEENLDTLIDWIYEISQTDNVVVQDFIPSRVRQLYSREFLQDMVDRFAKIGIPVLLDRDPQTPLFSYFRQIVVLGLKGYEISHHITVVSTRGIANVGQGGLLYEYRDEIINPRYRQDLRRGITQAVFRSIEAQKRYLREHCRDILTEYLEAYPQYQGKVKMELGQDLTGFSDSDIPYEMGDYMPVFLVDEKDNLISIYDEEKEQIIPLFDAKGQPTDVIIYDKDKNPLPRVDERGNSLPIPMFDEKGNRLDRFDAKGRPIPTLVVFKIESNPGAGLWRPHNDQLPEERKGEGVFTIFKCLGQRAALYRKALA